jgi:hypothetical protein
MQGHWIGEESDRKSRSPSEVFQAPGKIASGRKTCSYPPPMSQRERWKPDIKNWAFKTTLQESQPASLASCSKSTPRDLSVLGKTTTALLDEFLTNPAPFMGTKI